MKPYAHQVTIADEGFAILKKHGLVYLALEERTGKTLTSILIAEKSTRMNVLVLTKKKALDGWHDTLKQYSTNGTKFTVTNYHQACKLEPVYDLAILDESHSYLSAYPKRGKIWKDVKRLTIGQPLIYLSATPYAETGNQLFNQFSLSDWSPFKFKNFYDYFRAYGVSDKTRTPYGLQETYKKCKPSVLEKCKHLFIYYTRKELGFKQEPKDDVRYVKLDSTTSNLIKDCVDKELVVLDGVTMPLDSPMKLRVTIYMLEGGAYKNEGTPCVLPNREKIDYILKEWGDSEQLVIMYQYVAEGIKLRNIFKKAQILQGDAFAEGVDLSDKETLVVYSMSFSTSKYIQRRARQANKNRVTPIVVKYLLVEKGISAAVYEAVAKKKINFIKASYDSWTHSVG